MKKLVCIIVILCSLFSFACAEIDLSNMTYNELVELKDKINLAIWESSEWQEVTVPQGLWVVGEDIPAGHWTISAPPNASYTVVECGELLDNSNSVTSENGSIYYGKILYGVEGVYYKEGSLYSFDVVLEPGMYVQIENRNAIFTPFAGKPDLGFK